MKPPVIIIGAGRSGTNALRDALCRSDDFDTWPCDEINYIWRSGNRGFPTDELRREHARPDVTKKIIAAFEKRDAVAPGRIVEKTCANSLRVEFVHQILPEATFIHLVRDGRAVTASSMQRWVAPLDISYLASKARYVPPLDLPYYAFKYLRSRVDRVLSDEDRLSWWGPRFEGMQAFDSTTPLAEVAAQQWRECVDRARVQLAGLPQTQVYTLTYRDLVSHPEEQLGKLFDFLGSPQSADRLSTIAATIHGGSLDNWKRSLTTEDRRAVETIVGPLNAELGLGVA